jgi:septal ring factor EnvC (AmiA/AmiB activator)
MQVQEMEYSSPVHKLVAFFRSSRDKWKAKHQELKKELKRAQNQARAVEKSRARWRQDAENVRVEVAQLRAELEALKNCSA